MDPRVIAWDELILKKSEMTSNLDLVVLCVDVKVRNDEAPEETIDHLECSGSPKLQKRPSGQSEEHQNSRDTACVGEKKVAEDGPEEQQRRVS